MFSVACCTRTAPRPAHACQVCVACWRPVCHERAGDRRTRADRRHTAHSSLVSYSRIEHCQSRQPDEPHTCRTHAATLHAACCTLHVAFRMLLVGSCALHAATMLAATTLLRVARCVLQQCLLQHYMLRVARCVLQHCLLQHYTLRVARCVLCSARCKQRATRSWRGPRTCRTCRW